MSLPVTNLDDRKYQDLVDEAKLLIPQFCPEWTNHNLSDPGVALIELFAWMSEMMLFRLNQVPDVFYTRMLNLVGIDTFSATPAKADLTFWLTPGQEDDVAVPSGTEVATTTDTDDSIIFTTLEDLVVHQPNATAALTTLGDDHYTDVWAELGYEREPVPCFGRLNPDNAILFGYDSSLAGLAIRLDIRAHVEGIGVNPTDPPLAWEVWTGEAWAPVKVFRDTTGGINRDGSVTLLIPREHKPLTLASTQAHWLRARLLPTRPDQPDYRASPQILTMETHAIGGTVTAEHSHEINEEFLGISDGKPDQRFRVASTPVLPRREGESIVVVTDDGREDWHEVDDFTESRPQDRHFVWDDASGEIRFGPHIRYPDGSHRQHGAIPGGGAEMVACQYRHGGGAPGNVGAHTLSALRTTLPFVSSVQNVEPAGGGVDAESVENAKHRGPATLRSGDRAVTRADFERLTLEADHSIARARCLPPTVPNHPIDMLIVPAVENEGEQQDIDAYQLPPQMIDRVMRSLDERRILGAEVEIKTPYYQGVTVAALMKSLPGRQPAVVRSRAIDALEQYVNPLTGGPDGNGWPFDTDLNAVNVFQLLESVDGVERVDDVLFFTFDLRNGKREGPGKEVIRLAPNSLFISQRHQVVMR